MLCGFRFLERKCRNAFCPISHFNWDKQTHNLWPAWTNQKERQNAGRKKNVYKLKKTQQCTVSYHPSLFVPHCTKTLAKPPVPRACCGPQPQTKFWSYLAVVIQTRRRRELKTQIFRKLRNLLWTLSLWNTDTSSLPQLVSLLGFRSQTLSCVGQ